MALYTRNKWWWSIQMVSRFKAVKTNWPSPSNNKQFSFLNIIEKQISFQVNYVITQTFLINWALAFSIGYHFFDNWAIFSVFFECLYKRKLLCPFFERFLVYTANEMGRWCIYYFIYKIKGNIGTVSHRIVQDII